MDPINYQLNAAPPLQSFMQGLQGGAAVNQLQLQQKQQQAQQQQLAQMNIDLSNLAKNPTTEGIIQASIKYPSLSEQFKRSYDMLTPQEKEAKISSTIPIYTAAVNGRPDIAAKLLNEQADALENSGQKQQADQVRAHAQAIVDHPEITKLQAGLLLSTAMGADQFKTLNDSIIAQAKAPSEISQSESEATMKRAEAAAAPSTVALKNADISSQIKNRADQLNLDYAKLLQDRDLKLAEMNQKLLTPSETAQKVINDAASTAATSDQAATKYLDFANRLEQADPSSFGSGLAEKVKNATGGQDDITSLRKEYERIRSAGIAQMYKGLGTMSDSDVKVAMGTFLPETADTKQLAKFVRGMAKLNQLESVTQDAKSDWVGAVGHLGSAKKPMKIAGYDVPAGMTFTEFANKYASQKAANILAGKGAETTKTRSYMDVPQKTGAELVPIIQSQNISPAPANNGWVITPIGNK